MNGVTRNIQAEIAEKGIKGEEALKAAMSPEAMRSETGTAEEERKEAAE